MKTIILSIILLSSVSFGFNRKADSTTNLILSHVVHDIKDTVDCLGDSVFIFNWKNSNGDSSSISITCSIECSHYTISVRQGSLSWVDATHKHKHKYKRYHTCTKLHEKTIDKILWMVNNYFNRNYPKW